MNLTLFKDNPELSFKVIETYKGEKEYRINCREILGKYYRINEDCFLIDGKWYRVNSELIEFDNESREWVLVSKVPLIKGIISFDPSPKFGRFRPNPFNNCIYHDQNGTQHICINEKILIESGRIEDFSVGQWLDRVDPRAKGAQTPKNVANHTEKGYNIEDNAKEYADKIKLWNEYKQPLSKNTSLYGHMLEDTTFGVEIECSHGNLPEHIQNRTGTVICRDGSLKDEHGMPGPEFVTIPLNGAKGLQTLSVLGQELPKRTKLNLNCSLHIHFGTIPTTRMYLVSLFKLGLKIQNELFTMFPYYKAKPDGVKSKNYNQKLPTLNIRTISPCATKEEFNKAINGAYTRMFSWLAGGYNPDASRNRKNKKHPVQAKWDRHNRYFWLNFMNTMFSERNTVEFRLHGPTTNSQKMINWLFICNAIIKYAHSNGRKILLTSADITLSEVLDYYTKFGANGKLLSEYLKAYVEHRKAAFLKDYLKGDLISEWDYKNDSDYVFTHNNISHLI